MLGFSHVDEVLSEGLLGIRNIPVLETTLRRTGVVKVWASHDYTRNKVWVSHDYARNKVWVSHDYTRNVAGFRLWALYGSTCKLQLTFFTDSC